MPLGTPFMQLLVAAFSALLALVGGGGSSAPTPQDEPPISPPVPVSGLMDLDSPNDLSPDQIAEGLEEYLNSTGGPAEEQVKALLAHWGLEPVANSTLVLTADLDGDGAAETIAVCRDTDSATGAMGTLFVISGTEGEYQVDDAGEEVLMPALYAAADLNQDGRKEIIWASTSTGANTSYSQMNVSTWSPGRLVTYPQALAISNLMQAEVKDGALVLTGNTRGGWGAGSAQRPQILTYAWEDNILMLKDKQFAPSEYSYHRLQDGLWAEEMGKLDEAAAAYAQAAEPDREVLPPGDSVSDEWRSKLADAVRTFSQLRMALLKIDAGAPQEQVDQVLGSSSGPYAGLTRAALGKKDRQEVCIAVMLWAEEYPEFIQALSSPRGYANPQWAPDSLCGPMPTF